MRVASTCFSLLCLCLLLAAEAHANTASAHSRCCQLLSFKSCGKAVSIRQNLSENESGFIPLWMADFEPLEFKKRIFLNGLSSTKLFIVKEYAFVIFSGLSPPNHSFNV